MNLDIINIIKQRIKKPLAIKNNNIFQNFVINFEKENHLIGRCFVSDNGEIGTIGSLCKVIESKRMDDGKGFFIIESIQRIKIQKIIKRFPYLRAIVELEYNDDVIINESELEENDNLCYDVFILLKTYLRIAKIQSRESYRDQIILSLAVKDNRPLPSHLMQELTLIERFHRQVNFSYAIWLFNANKTYQYNIKNDSKDGIK
jgi:ATP-dependent Lon protease